jgi:hypothetical protein
LLLEPTLRAKSFNSYVHFTNKIDNNLGHGSFLLSNNSYSWSHAFAANNIQNSSFTFVEGNIIKVEVTETELIYTNESQQNKVCRLPLALN